MYQFFKTIFFRICIVFLCIGAFAHASSSTQIENLSSSFIADRFQVAFPSDPTSKSEELMIKDTKLIYQEFASSNRGVLYTVSYVDFPSVWKFFGANKILTKTFEEFVKYEKGINQVLLQEMGTHAGYPALSYKFNQNGKEVEGKFVVAGYTLYKVSIHTPTELAGTVNPSSFFDSFQLPRGPSSPKV